MTIKNVVKLYLFVFLTKNNDFDFKKTSLRKRRHNNIDDRLGRRNVERDERTTRYNTRVHIIYAHQICRLSISAREPNTA